MKFYRELSGGLKRGSRVRGWRGTLGLAVLGWLLILPVLARADAGAADQSYLVDIWETEHGLPENIVNAIAQTPEGYLWCGTTHGLARFDGVRFKVFNSQNTPQLVRGFRGSRRDVDCHARRTIFARRHGKSGRSGCAADL